MSDDTPTVTPPSKLTVRTIYGLLILTLVVVLLSWRSCWYGAPMTDGEIRSAIAGKSDLTTMQKALAQVDDRLAKEDADALEFIPAVIAAAKHEDATIRRTVAWTLGDAKNRPEVIAPLVMMLGDRELLVRGQAAIALANHGKADGRTALKELIGDYAVRAPADGTLRQALRANEPVRTGIRLAQIEPAGGGAAIDVIASMEGRVAKFSAKVDAPIKKDDVILQVEPGDTQIANALAALYLVGTKDDISAVQRLLESNTRLTTSARARAEEVVRKLNAVR